MMYAGRLMTKWCDGCRQHLREEAFIEFIGMEEREHSNCLECRKREYASHFENTAEEKDEKVCTKCHKLIDRRAFVNKKTGVEYASCSTCNFRKGRRKEYKPTMTLQEIKDSNIPDWLREQL